SVQLRRESLVVRENEGGTTVIRDDVRQGHGLSRPGDAKQGLVTVSPLETITQTLDGFRLISRRLEGSKDFEGGTRHEAKYTGFGGSSVPLYFPPGTPPISSNFFH